MTTYYTQVTSFKIDPDQPAFLSIEVPEGFLKDLDLKENEILKWEIDPESQTAVITKEKIIINK